MPRRIATQVSQLLSRQLRGNYLKQPPVGFQTLIDHPHTPLPPRAPVERPAIDSQSVGGKKQSKRLKLDPQPIVYLEDRVRERFYNDHPWETFQPRTLVEGRTVDAQRRIPDPNAVDLTAWGRNPSPEDAIACVVHLHQRHGLSLSQAYHNTLSSYHALRAEHDHAARAALFEARSHGAVFGRTSANQPTAAAEVERGFRKEADELRKGAKLYVKTFGGGVGAASSNVGGALTAAEEQARQKYRFRVRNTWAPMSQGVKYLEAALAARDRIGAEQVSHAKADGARRPVQDTKKLAGLLGR